VRVQHPGSPASGATALAGREVFLVGLQAAILGSLGVGPAIIKHKVPAPRLEASSEHRCCHPVKSCLPQQIQR
jgi:hypothetical protein